MRFFNISENICFMDRNRAVNIVIFIIFLFEPNYVTNGELKVYSWPFFTIIDDNIVHLVMLDMIPYILLLSVIFMGVFVSVPTEVTFQYYLRVILVSIVTILFLFFYHNFTFYPKSNLLSNYSSIGYYYYYGLFTIIFTIVTHMLITTLTSNSKLRKWLSTPANGTANTDSSIDHDIIS